MQNFRTLGLIIKKVRDLFNLPDKYGKIIQCDLEELITEIAHITEDIYVFRIARKLKINAF